MAIADNFEQMFKMGKNSGIPLSDINKTATDLCREMGEECTKIFQKNMELFSDQMKRITTAKKPEDLLNISRECFTEDLEAGMETAKRLIKIQTKSIEELSSKISSSVSEAGSKMREAGEEVIQKAHHTMNKSDNHHFKGKDRFNK